MAKDKQLIMFDCDDERANLFGNKSILQKVPLQIDCCLFWNKSNETITKKFEQLHNIPHIYLYPSNTSDSNNPTVSKLTYFLGKYAYYYKFILIIHGDDNIYNEVMANIIEDYGKKSIGEKKIQQPTVETLQKLFMEIEGQNTQPNHIKNNSPIILSQSLPLSQLINIPEKRCAQCARTFITILSLFDHIKCRHKCDAMLVCNCSFKCNKSSDFSQHLRTKKEIFSDEGIVSCKNTGEPPDIYINPHSAPLILLPGKMNACIFECLHRWFTPADLFYHFKTAHKKQIDIRIQCCSSKTKYTLDEFCDHVASEHSIVDIQ